MIRLEEQKASLGQIISIPFLVLILFITITCRLAATSSFKDDLASCGEHFASHIHDIIEASSNGILSDSRGATIIFVAGTGTGSPIQKLCRGMQYEIKVTFNSPRIAHLTASQGSFSAAVAGCPQTYSQNTPVSTLTVKYTAPCSAEDGLVLFRLTSVDPTAPLELLGMTTSMQLHLDPDSDCTSDVCTVINTSYSRVLAALGPVVTQAAVDDWLGNQQLAFFPTRVTYEEASTRCLGLGARLVTVAEWIEAVDVMRTGGERLGDILVSILLGLYDFGDNNGRPWNAWGANNLGRRTCSAVQIDSSTVTVPSSAPSVNCTQLLYYMCVGRYFVLDPPPPPPPSPPPPPPRPPVVPNPGIRDVWDERLWTFFDYRVQLRDADARCRDIGGGAHLASLAEWQDLSRALAASRVSRMYNGMSAAMFYFGDYVGRPWNFWSAGGPGAGQGGCGAVRVDPLAIIVTQTSLAASCQQNLMFLCVQLAVGLPNLPAEPPLHPPLPKPKPPAPPLPPPLKPPQPLSRPSTKPPPQKPVIKLPPPLPPSPKPPRPSPPPPPSPKPPRPPRPSPPPSPRPPRLPKPPSPSPHPPNYPPLPPSPPPPGHPQLPPPSLPPPKQPFPPLLPSLQSPRIPLPPPPGMPSSHLSDLPPPGPTAPAPSPIRPSPLSPKPSKPSTRPSRRPHASTPPSPPPPSRPPLPLRSPQHLAPPSPPPPRLPSPQPSPQRPPLSPVPPQHPTPPPPPPPSQCSPSAQGFDCSLSLGEGLTIHWSPASLMTLGVMPSSPPSSPPAASPCVQEYSDPTVKATFHILLDAAGASQISLAFLPIVRGGISPGISAFVTEDGAIRDPSYEAVLIPAPGRIVQLYNATTDDPYGPGPWPFGPPGPSTWAVDKAAVRSRSSSGSTRLALCFSAAAPPPGARSLNAFMVTLVPEQRGSSGNLNVAARQMWAVDGHEYHHSYYYQQQQQQHAELQQKHKQHRRSFLLSHQRQQQTTEAGQMLDPGSEVQTTWNAGGAVDRRLAAHSYDRNPPPSDYDNHPPPPFPSPETPAVSILGNTVSVRLGYPGRGRQVTCLRRAGTLPECELACNRMGLMLGSSSRPGYNLTGIDYDAAWAAVLQQLLPEDWQNRESGSVVGGWVGPAQPDAYMHHYPHPGSSNSSPPLCTSTILDYQYGWLRSAPCSTLGWCLCWSPEEAPRE